MGAAGLKVTNGREVPEGIYRQVVQLSDGSGGWCTGTFIRDDTVLTAAHCTTFGKWVDGDDSGQVAGQIEIVQVIDRTRYTTKTLAVSTAIYRHPQWAGAYARQNVNPYDLALIIFPAGTSLSNAVIASTPAAVGDPFTLIGFGLNYVPAPGDEVDLSSAGIKRVGTNKVSTVRDGFIGFMGTSMTSSGDGTCAIAASGDSGAPLFIGGKVAGVISSGGRMEDCCSASSAVDLQSAASKAFLHAHGFF